MGLCPSSENQPSSPFASFSEWPKARINSECGLAYRRYERCLREHYVSYFNQRPWLQDAHQSHSASTMAAALPPGWNQLERLIPRPAIHPLARSAKSSQTLSLALLGGALSLAPSLNWFRDAFEIEWRPTSRTARASFERGLARSDLNEEPRTTQLDFAVEDSSCFVAVESKWCEQGFDVCSCLRSSEGTHLPGGYCSDRVLNRPRYWDAARDFFGLPPERLPLLPCQIAPVYQVLRNVAAARQLAGVNRSFGFVLLFDQNNPYFRPTGSWPGWPAVLRTHFERHKSQRFFFRAVAWQQLISRLPLDPNIRGWARVKHLLY
jgi:hypothetical protein